MSDPAEAPRVPLRELPAASITRLSELGGRPVNLYRALANQPALLRAWIEFAWTLRRDCATPARLRELLILGVAHRTSSPYQWSNHLHRASDAGVTEEEIAGIQRWREAPVYGPIERAVLAFGDAMADGAVPTPIWHDLATHFDDAECVELTLTAAFYVMGGRTVAALRIPLDVAPR